MSSPGSGLPMAVDQMVLTPLQRYTLARLRQGYTLRSISHKAGRSSDQSRYQAWLALSQYVDSLTKDQPHGL